jgi:hypothetical protein
VARYDWKIPVWPDHRSEALDLKGRVRSRSDRTRLVSDLTGSFGS